MIHYRHLDPATDSIPEPWTFPACRHLLSLRPSTRFANFGPSGQVQPFAHLALADDRPVAMALACRPVLPDQPDLHGELLSIFVDPEFRRQGVAERLLAELESVMTQAGCLDVETTYMTGSPFIPALESLLRNRDWESPQTRMWVIRATMEEAFSAPWFGRYPHHRHLVIVPWSQVAEDLYGLRRQHEKNSWIAEDLRPWKFDLARAEQASSLGILLHGEIVGWVMNHRLDSDLLRVTNAFMRPDLARRGRLLPVLTESLRRAHAAGFRRLSLAAATYHPDMVRFYREWCAPYVSFFGETRGSRKALASKGD